MFIFIEAEQLISRRYKEAQLNTETIVGSARIAFEAHGKGASRKRGIPADLHKIGLKVGPLEIEGYSSNPVLARKGIQAGFIMDIIYFTHNPAAAVRVDARDAGLVSVMFTLPSGGFGGPNHLLAYVDQKCLPDLREIFHC